MIQKPVAGPNEGLVKHLVGVLKVSLDLAERMRISDPLIIRSLHLASLLHDIGKSLKMYQDEPYFVDKGVFPGHEILSALIFLNISDELGSLSDEEKCIILYSIIMHHQAMSSMYDRLLYLSGRFVCTKEEEYLKNTLLEIGKYIHVSPNRILTLYHKSVIPLTRISAISMKRKQARIREFMKCFKPAFQLMERSSKDTILKARLCCAILMIADTYVAMKNRGEEPSSSYRKMVFSLLEDKKTAKA